MSLVYAKNTGRTSADSRSLHHNMGSSTRQPRQQFKRASSDTRSNRNLSSSGTRKQQQAATPSTSNAAGTSSSLEVTAVQVTPDEFLSQFRAKTSECLSNAYLSDHPIYRSREGRLATSLGSEIFTLFNMLLDIMDEYLVAGSLVNSDAGDAIVIDVVEFLLLNLKYKQTHFRDRCLQDLESCCAASNDFFGMTETADEVVTRVLNKYQLRENRRKAKSMLRKKSQDLISLYSSDAVYSAQMTHLYVFEPICDRIEQDLFGEKWESSFTQNEVALSIVRTIEDFLGDIEVYLSNDFITKKVIDALVSATVVFYVRCLLLKARQKQWLHKSTGCKFIDPQRAVTRISGDIVAMKGFFTDLADRMPALSRVIEKEFAVLTAIYECLCIGVGMSNADIHDFVPVLHKITKHYDVTRNLVCDMYALVSPKDEHRIRGLVASMKKDLVSFPDVDSQTGHTQPPERSQVPGLSLENMLVDFYDIHGFGGRLHKLSPKHMIDHLQHGVHVVREKRDEAESGEDSSVHVKILDSLQDLRAKSMRLERRASF
mmetsp:Transcript_34396/g.74623  ORF Transcript_34396/g.74623 Transcript_34396/m.74623 type:complete len:543 (-) Transcript_34396:669-2297(-)